ITVCRETEGFSLIRQGKTIVGVHARDKNGVKEGRCRAVVLGAGVFQANPEMVVRYLGKGGANLVLRGSPTNTGDGIRMAQEVGAAIDWLAVFPGGLVHYGYKKYPEVG